MDRLEPTEPLETAPELAPSPQPSMNEDRERDGSSGSASVHVYNGPFYNAPTYQNSGQVGAMGDLASSIQGGQSSASPSVSQEERHRNADRLTFAKVQQLLTRDGSMRFVEENNFAGFSFENANMHEIWNFLHEAGDPEFEFLDEDLELRFGELKDGLARFSHEVARNTFRTDPGFNSVPAEFEYQCPDRFRQMVNDIHNAAATATAAHVAFVRLARRKLA